MKLGRANRLISATALILLIGATAGLGRGWLSPEDRLDDGAFWKMFSEFSEPSGFFPSDNLVSNELTFPALMPDIAKRFSNKGAFVGVGPEQNFSYIVALRPRIAFIVDIRRQNAMLHFLYKALFELAPTRAEFLSRLFSRARPDDLANDAPVARLLDAYTAVPANAAAFDANLRDVRTLLVDTHRFALNEEDLAGIRYVYSAFFEEGPSLQYSFGSLRRGRPFPTFSQLMTANDERGIPGGFLATEQTYGALRDMQLRNLIVPVVGDFAGEKGLRSVASYLKQRELALSVLYTSNVEQYLFRSEDWRSFYGNVARFPVTADSVLVRSVFNRYNGSVSYGAAPVWPFGRGTLHLDPIQSLTQSFERGEILGYTEIVDRSR